MCWYVTLVTCSCLLPYWCENWFLISSHKSPNLFSFIRWTLLFFCYSILYFIRDPSFKVRNSLRSNYFVVMKKFMPWLKAALKIHTIPSFFTYYYYLLDFHLFYISPSSISLSSNLSSFMPNSFYNILSKFFLILLDLLPLPLIIYISI